MTEIHIEFKTKHKNIKIDCAEIPVWNYSELKNISDTLRAIAEEIEDERTTYVMEGF